MKQKKLFILILLSFGLLFAMININPYADTLKTLSATAETYDYNEDNNKKFSDNSAIIILTEEATIQSLYHDYTPADFAEINAIDVEELTKYTIGWVRDTVAGLPTEPNEFMDVDGYQRAFFITLPEHSREKVLRAVNILKLREDIESAYTNDYIYAATTNYNDPDIEQQWGLDNITIPEAWNFSTGRSNVLVGVLDTGIYGEHEDLKDSFYSFLHQDFTKVGDNRPNINSYKDIYDADSFGHGTRVAGIIAAQANNAVGVAGIASNIKLVSLRVLNNSKGSELDSQKAQMKCIYEAIDYARIHNIPILNYSGVCLNYYSIKEALKKYPGLFICAAGNDQVNLDSTPSYNYGYPAFWDLPNVITVGASTRKNKKWEDSSYGQKYVDLFAPGEDIYSTTNDGGYGTASGTSFAAPYVTGVAALLKSYNNDLTSEQIKEIILQTVSKQKELKDQCVSGGILNAGAALRSIGYKTTPIDSTNVRIEEPYFTPINVSIPAYLNGKRVYEISENAFKGREELKSFSAKCNIPAYAFEGCSNLESVSLSGNVEANAFYGCEALKTANIFSKKIGSNWFKNCNNLNEVIINRGVEEIGDYAFYNLPQLSTVKFWYIFFTELTVVKIGSYAFGQCQMLKEISIPFTVTEIGNYAFYYSGLTSLEFKNDSKLNTIGDYAFAHCPIVSVKIPASLRRIGMYAFDDTRLSSVTFENNSVLSYIGDSAFSNRGRIKEVYIGDIVSWSNIEFTNETSNPLNSGAKLYVQWREVTNLVIPERITEIKAYAFYGCGSLQTVTFEGKNNINSIGKFAFSNCTQLKTLSLPSSVESIEEGAFLCAGLQGITFEGNNLQFIGNKAFANCENLTDIELPDSVAEIGRNIFDSCLSLSNVKLSQALTEIPSGAFYNCKSLYYIEIPDSIEVLGSDVFSNCSALREIDLSKTKIDSIKSYAFYKCNNLNSVKIPLNLLSIGESAFYDCYNLMDFNIPLFATSIGDSAFYNCKSITKLNISNASEIGRGAFNGCYSLTNLILPFVGNSANGTTNTHFGYIFGATNYSTQGSYIPSSLKTVRIYSGNIADNAFYNCNQITEIVLERNIQNIGKGAFYGCDSLAEVMLPFVGNSLKEPTSTHFGYIFGAPDYHSQSSYVPLSLKTVWINYGNIADYAFYNCNEITEIKLDKPIQSIGYGAFFGCGSLATLKLPFVGNIKNGTTNTHLGYIFGASDYISQSEFVPTSLKQVNIGYSILGSTSSTNILKINDYAFYGCHDLQNVSLLSSVTEIGKYAFSDSGIINVNFDFKTGWAVYDDKGNKMASISPDSLSDPEVSANLLKAYEEYTWKRKA